MGNCLRQRTLKMIPWLSERPYIGNIWEYPPPPPPPPPPPGWKYSSSPNCRSCPSHLLTSKNPVFWKKNPKLGSRIILIPLSIFFTNMGLKVMLHSVPPCSTTNISWRQSSWTNLLTGWLIHIIVCFLALPLNHVKHINSVQMVPTDIFYDAIHVGVIY